MLKYSWNEHHVIGPPPARYRSLVPRSGLSRWSLLSTLCYTRSSSLTSSSSTSSRTPGQARESTPAIASARSSWTLRLLIRSILFRTGRHIYTRTQTHTETQTTRLYTRTHTREESEARERAIVGPFGRDRRWSCRAAPRLIPSARNRVRIEGSPCSSDLGCTRVASTRTYIFTKSHMPRRAVSE